MKVIVLNWLLNRIWLIDWSISSDHSCRWFIIRLRYMWSDRRIDVEIGYIRCSIPTRRSHLYLIHSSHSYSIPYSHSLHSLLFHSSPNYRYVDLSSCRFTLWWAEFGSILLFIITRWCSRIWSINYTIIDIISSSYFIYCPYTSRVSSTNIIEWCESSSFIFFILFIRSLILLRFLSLPLLRFLLFFLSRQWEIALRAR